MEEKKVSDILEEVSNEMCDGYCKYPDQYDNDYMLHEERCSKCPLNKL